MSEAGGRVRETVDFDRARDLALFNVDAILAELLPGGRLRGREYEALNPKRADGSIGSFKVNVDKGVWSDFATGDTGDLISLWAYLAGTDKADAARAILARFGAERSRSAKPAAGKTKRKPRETWTPVLPVPDDAPEPPAAHYHYGRPEGVWAYRDSAGALLGYVWRVTKSDGGKEILPLTWCVSGSGGHGWQFRGFVEPRPLYGLDRLAMHPGKRVLVVEGEKCADAGYRLLSSPLRLRSGGVDTDRLLSGAETTDTRALRLRSAPDSTPVVITWPGGSNSPHKADWTPLAGREVICWPDRDDPGYDAMRTVARLLGGIAKSVKVIAPPDGDEKGWDIADAVQRDGWTRAQIMEFLADEDELPSEEALDMLKNGPSVHPEQVISDDCGSGRRINVVNDSENGDGNGSDGGDGEDFAAPRAAPRQYNHTDSGGAERLIDSYGRDIRYNAKPFATWFWYDSIKWREDRSNRIYAYVDRMIGDILAEAATAPQKQREALGKWAYRLERMGSQRSLVAKAETVQRASIAIEDLDSRGYLFNCRNATIDLESGEPVARGHAREDYLTIAADIDYNPEAVCPHWEAFIDRIFDHDDSLIQFVQRAIGYSMVDDVSEQCLFFCYGVGANGKSVFFETIRRLLGDYGGKAPSEMLMQQQFSQVPTDVADLRGKRFVVASEIEEGKRWAESRIKDLTGGDTQKARRMREDFFEFKQTHKLWIFGNHQPILKGTDEGIRRRIRIVPFEVIIPPEERVPMETLLTIFRRELSGILNWALAGYVSWRDKGLGWPDKVRDATGNYFADSDIIQQYIDECCETGDTSHYSVEGGKLYGNYLHWCETQGIRAFSRVQFYRSLSERGFVKRVGTGNKTYIDGMMLADVQTDMRD